MSTWPPAACARKASHARTGTTPPRPSTGPSATCNATTRTRPRTGAEAMPDDIDDEADVVALLYEIGGRRGSTGDRRVREVHQSELHPPDGVVSEAQARAAYRARLHRRSAGRSM